MFLTTAMEELPETTTTEEPPEKIAKTIENPIIQEPASLLSQASRQAIATIMNTLPEEMTHYLTTIAINEPINKSGKRWLHMARTPEDVYKALALGANVNILTNKDETPLNTILANGYTDAAIALVTHGKNVNLATYDIYDTTPLHNAAFTGNEKIIELLIPAYERLDILDSAGFTPLFYAISNNPSVVSFLIEKGERADEVNTNRTTALHVAAQFNPSLLPLLLDHGAKILINDRNNRGLTPLHKATYLGRADGVRILLENGADPNIPDNDQRTPIFSSIETRSYTIKNIIGQQRQY